MKKLQQTPMSQAIERLFEIEAGSGLATPEQLLEVANEFELEVHSVEGIYLVAVDRLSDA